MRLQRIGLMLLGFTVTLGLVALGASLWGNHIEHRIDHVVIERRRDHRVLIELAKGGDASQPASAGQPPEPGQPGGTGGSKPPKGASGGSAGPHNPGSGTSPEQPSEPPAPAPAELTSPPETQTAAPGLLDPALSAVCSIADRLAHLCSN